jgi:hypothetical protein
MSKPCREGLKSVPRAGSLDIHLEADEIKPALPAASRRGAGLRSYETTSESGFTATMQSPGSSTFSSAVSGTAGLTSSSAVLDRERGVRLFLRDGVTEGKSSRNGLRNGRTSLRLSSSSLGCWLDGCDSSRAKDV